MPTGFEQNTLKRFRNLFLFLSSAPIPVVVWRILAEKKLYCILSLLFFVLTRFFFQIWRIKNSDSIFWLSAIISFFLLQLFCFDWWASCAPLLSLVEPSCLVQLNYRQMALKANSALYSVTSLCFTRRCQIFASKLPIYLYFHLWKILCEFKSRAL